MSSTITARLTVSCCLAAGPFFSASLGADGEAGISQQWGPPNCFQHQKHPPICGGTGARCGSHLPVCYGNFCSGCLPQSWQKQRRHTGHCAGHAAAHHPSCRSADHTYRYKCYMLHATCYIMHDCVCITQGVLANKQLLFLQSAVLCLVPGLPLHRVCTVTCQLQWVYTSTARALRGRNSKDKSITLHCIVQVQLQIKSSRQLWQQAHSISEKCCILCIQTCCT